MNFKAPPEINEDTPGCHQTSVGNLRFKKERSKLIKHSQSQREEIHIDRVITLTEEFYTHIRHL